MRPDEQELSDRIFAQFGDQARHGIGQQTGPPLQRKQPIVRRHGSCGIPVGCDFVFRRSLRSVDQYQPTATAAPRAPQGTDARRPKLLRPLPLDPYHPIAGGQNGELFRKPCGINHDDHLETSVFRHQQRFYTLGNIDAAAQHRNAEILRHTAADSVGITKQRPFIATPQHRPQKKTNRRNHCTEKHQQTDSHANERL